MGRFLAGYGRYVVIALVLVAVVILPGPGALWAKAIGLVGAAAVALIAYVAIWRVTLRRELARSADRTPEADRASLRRQFRRARKGTGTGVADT